MENKKNYGYFGTGLGSYTITELPKVGLYEYIYKNDEVLLKMDQYGFQTAQINPPVGEALFKREKRELSSPAKIYFDLGKGVTNNFDAYRADKIKIDFTPERATYTFDFGDITVKSEIFVTASGQKFVLRASFENRGYKAADIKVMPCVYPYVNPLLMAPWDKPEWYTRSEYSIGEYPVFRATRFSVSGNKAERKYFTASLCGEFSSFELSSERLTAQTNNFAIIPDAFSGESGNMIYTFEQCFAAIGSMTLEVGECKSVAIAFSCVDNEEKIDGAVKESYALLSEEGEAAEMAALMKKYNELFSGRTVKTPDEDFNRFVNGFLPLELDWVSALDRGWPTGMRGVRDAANDFAGFFPYDKDLCRDVLTNIFSKQRSDGWYPRQVPFGNGDKFDLRHFVDSACFFTEFVYDYIAYTDDLTVLTEKFGYYDSDAVESGLEHLTRGVRYLMAEENIGEHGLVKMRGGDWLDCLNAAGIAGRGETVMVSCQLIASIGYLTEILQKMGLPVDKEYQEFSDKLKAAINKYSYCDEGFYRGVFTDAGEWIFSECDPDGEKRVYAPTNSYAVITGVAEGKEARVLENIKSLRCDEGYKLFTTPFGKSEVRNIGKMGTGDFQPYFAENGSIYNHGSQCFVLRALARVGDHETFSDVLNFALPLDEERHAPDALCSAPYAITNCYQLVPSFRGRAFFSFLTGSVAMIGRAIYGWMMGVQPTLDTVDIKPCIPERYRDSVCELCAGNTRVKISYRGYGNRVVKAILNGKEISCDNGYLSITKDILYKESLACLDIEIE